MNEPTLKGQKLGNQRTTAQDMEFAVHQIVEIAVRALSPGINDPFTAVVCVDRLGSALCRLAQRETPSSYRFDEQQRLRVIANPISFTSTVDIVFNQIRQYARSSVTVTIRLLDIIAIIAGVVYRADDRLALRRHLDTIARGARNGLPEVEDRRVVAERYQLATLALRETDVTNHAGFELTGAA